MKIGQGCTCTSEYLSQNIRITQKNFYLRPKKRNCLFPVTVRKKCRLVGKKFFLHYFFGQKCVFYACFSLIGSWEVKQKLG